MRRRQGEARRPAYRRWLLRAGVLVILAVAARLWILPGMGRFLVSGDAFPEADAAVVLSTGVEYYPRLMEAAALFREGRVPLVVINGNRKTDSLRELEALGYVPAVPWDEDARRILRVLGVPRERVVSVSAEDAFDTISEARAVAPALEQRDIHRLVLVTSKYHTRRARHIWRNRVPGGFAVSTSAARQDPFEADGWWRSGRQIRWLLAEYGGWVFYFLSWVSEALGPDPALEPA